MGQTQVSNGGIQPTILEPIQNLYTGSTIVFTVTVASKDSTHRYNGQGSSNGYKIDGKFAPFIVLTPGITYKFDQADSSNSNHPLRFYKDAAKATAYTTNVTTNGTAGSSGAYTQIVTDDATPTILYYQCSQHGLMGNAVQTNGLASSVPDDGSITTAKLANDAVTTAKIADESVTLSKLPHGTSSNNGKFLRANNNGDPTFESVPNQNLQAPNGQTRILVDNTDINIGYAPLKFDTDPNNAFNIKIQGPSTLTKNSSFTLPEDGSNGQFLKTNGSGALSFETVNTDLSSDSSPQLGADLDTNGNDIDFADNDKATFGASQDLVVRHSSSDNNSYVEESGGGSLVVKSDDFYLQNAGANHTQIKSDSDAEVELSHNGTPKFQTTQDGAKILGTGNLILPSGDTSQRGLAQAGSIRYNTQTSQLEIHNGTTWVGVGKSTPQIVSVSNQTTNGAAGTTMVIKGEGFVSGCTVHYVGNDNTNIAAGTVTFNSSTQLTIVSPALTVDKAPYAIKVTNPDGGLIIAAPEVEVTAGSAPNWTTAQGQLGGGAIQKNAAVNITVAASDADGQAIAYSETTSVLTSNSNTPAATMNLSLNSSTGVISGTSPNVSADTTYNFTLRATDTATNFADRNFYIIVQAAPPPSYWFRGSSQGGSGLASGVTWSHTGYYPNATGGSNANSDRLYNYGQGNSGTYAGFRQTGYTNGITIPVGHDRCDIYISSIQRNNYSNGNQWTSTQPSGNSAGTAAFGDLMSNPSTGLHTYTIPSADQGQVRYFTMTGYAGQNGYWQQQVTLVKTYNQNNP